MSWKDKRKDPEVAKKQAQAQVDVSDRMRKQSAARNPKFSDTYTRKRDVTEADIDAVCNLIENELDGVEGACDRLGLDAKRVHELRIEGEFGTLGLPSYAYDRIRKAISESQARLRAMIIEGADQRARNVLEFQKAVRPDYNAKAHIHKEYEVTAAALHLLAVLPKMFEMIQEKKLDLDGAKRFFLSTYAERTAVELTLETDNYLLPEAKNENEDS